MPATGKISLGSVSVLLCPTFCGFYPAVHTLYTDGYFVFSLVSVLSMGNVCTSTPSHLLSFCVYGCHLTYTAVLFHSVIKTYVEEEYFFCCFHSLLGIFFHAMYDIVCKVHN